MGKIEIYFANALILNQGLDMPNILIAFIRIIWIITPYIFLVCLFVCLFVDAFQSSPIHAQVIGFVFCDCDLNFFSLPFDHSHHKKHEKCTFFKSSFLNSIYYYQCLDLTIGIKIGPNVLWCITCDLENEVLYILMTEKRVQIVIIEYYHKYDFTI